MPTFQHDQCTNENLAPGSEAAVWQSISKIMTFISGLTADFTATVRNDHAIVFRSAPGGKNLITIFPRRRTLGIDLRGSGPESLNRTSGARKFEPLEVEQEFEMIRNGIYESFVG